MGLVVRKQKGLILSRVCKLSVAIFIAAIGFSIVDTFWSVYMESFFDSVGVVGIVSAFLALVSFFSFFLITPIIEKRDKSKIFVFSLFAIAVSYFVFAVSRNFYLFLIVAILATVFHTLRVTSFGLIVKDKSSRRKLSRNEGLAYTFLNVAWFIGPLIAGFLARYFEINIVFGLSAIFIFISIFYFLSLRIRDKKSRRVDGSVVKLFFDFFRKRDRVVAYFLSGGVNYWWSLIYIFVPLYIIEKGLGLAYVGYFLFIVTIPLILFSYVFSNLAGRIGFKKIFKIGFFIPFLASLICFFVSDVYVVLLVLVLGGVGIAMLEATTEAYFFDTLKGKEDLRFYGPYNTTIDLNHFVSRILGGVVLLFLPFRFLFLFFGISMFGFFILSSRARNINESRRRN